MTATTTTAASDLLTRARIATRWPELGAGDLATIDGDPAYLALALTRHGRDAAQARREVDAWLAAHHDGGYHPLDEARALFAPAAQQVCDGMRGFGTGARVLARDLFAEGRERAGETAAKAEAGIDTAAGALAPVARFVRKRPVASLATAVAPGWLIEREH